ncbi:two pore domain potassium channel family protein [Methylopila sp. Yamaguchi]|uniref:two pore domain potassium channel family protein n=1 Tax=Methylopila sp. Yamaguchi TaxID=1437817 RepID=UPI000CB7E597|nr:two pore domain potassium channel family protein [Methylopila sp. Yamaguchi]GBD50162.1 hypothetical protein METY_3375 [Methylopila sp. Yamaguchi]
MTLEQLAGAALTLVFLADIFLTVLYARAGTGLLAPYWIRAIWAAIRGVARLFGRRRRGAVLSLAGPLIVVSLIGFWAIGLTIGAALVIQPALGVAIRPSSGGTPTDFVTALFVAGNSLSIVGGGGYSPQTAGTRILFLINALIGTSALSLVLSYLVQVYSALRERNTLALTIHLMTDSTGDAAVLLARLMPGGEIGNAPSELSNLARSLASTKEAHHFYPLLFYFRFEQPFYSVSRMSFVILDLTTLIDTALDRERYGSLINSAPVTSLRRAALQLLHTLHESFPTTEPRAEELAAGTRRSTESYLTAVDTLRRSGVASQLDGREFYVAARRDWEPLAGRLAPTLGHDVGEIDRRRPDLRGAGSVVDPDRLD